METGLKRNAATFSGSIRRFSMVLIVAVLSCLFIATPSRAQNDKGFTFSVGGGFSPLVGDISNRLDNGWQFAVDGGYDFTRHFSTTLEYMYNGYGVSRRVLNEARVPDGNAHLWAITVNPKVRLSNSSTFSPYLVGGVGYYRRTVELTSPTTVPVFFFDPFFGVFVNTLVPADRVLGDITRGGVGGSLGAGFEVKLGDSGVELFTEARYHYADTGSVPTRMVPVKFGIRFSPAALRPH